MPSMAITSAQRLKRVLKFDIQTCDRCGGAVKVITCIEEPALVKRILAHLEQRSESGRTMTRPARAPLYAAKRQGTIS